MSLLHYRLSHLGENWVLSCEGIPIEAHQGRQKAVHAAHRSMNCAKDRGDTVIFQEDGRGSQRHSLADIGA